MPGFRQHHRLQNLLLVIATLLLAGLIGEAVVRTALNPDDYLVPMLVEDEALNYRIRPGSAGHDALGFRNATVPDSADIVTIGDSQTYGWMSTEDSCWPSLLQKMTGRRVYNMSLGGYGPVQYAWLLEHYALRLHPHQIIVGFYFGNDVWDAYTVVYGRSYWSNLRRPDIQPQPFEIEKPHFLEGPRMWMSYHSVLYRLLVGVVANHFAQVKMRYFYTKNSDNTILTDPVHGVKTGLTPGMWLRGLDLNDPRIAEGLRLCFDAFVRMDSVCRVNRIDFTVLLIPTKENVYSPCLQTGSVNCHADVLQAMLHAEQQVRDTLVAFLDERHIQRVEALKPLQAAVGHPRLYPADQDGHPRQEGFRIIAQTVQKKIFP